MPTGAATGRGILARRDRARRRAAPEGAGPAGPRQPPGVRGAHRGGPGAGQRRGRHPGPAGRPRHRRGRRGWRAGRGPARPGLLPPQQAGGRGQHRLRPSGQAHGDRPGAPRAAGPSGRPPRRRQRGSPAAHQRRGSHVPLDAIPASEWKKSTWWWSRAPRDRAPCAACGRAWISRTAAPPRPGWRRSAPAACASPSTRAATARCGACATSSATRSAAWCAPASGRSGSASLAPGEWRELTPAEVRGIELAASGRPERSHRPA